MPFQHARERLKREGVRRKICTEQTGQMPIIAAREKELTGLRAVFDFWSTRTRHSTRALANISITCSRRSEFVSPSSECEI
jgi:hypothetical protein